MTEENVTTQEPNLAIVRLADIEDEVLVQDMNYEFFYKRIVKPDENPSDLFNLHYREETMQQWATCNGCLTEGFTVVKTEEAIRQIREGLGAELIGEKHFRHDTSVKSTFLLTDYELELQADTEADKLIFKLITNIDADIEVLSKAGMSFNIINGFSGNHALQLNYGFMKNIYGPEPEDGSERKCLSSNNPFLLDEYTHRLVHDRGMSVSFEEVSSVRDNIQTKIELFKTISILEPFIEEFERKFPKKFVKKYMALFEELPSDYKNLYWASFILGIIIESDKKIGQEIKLRSFIKEYVKAFEERPDIDAA